jgi:hypothetical protein
VAKSKKPAGKRSRGRAGRLDQIAEGVGTAIGTAQNTAEHWLSDPKQMLSQITNVRDAANRLIAQLTRTAAAPPTVSRSAGRKRESSARRRPATATQKKGARRITAKSR